MKIQHYWNGAVLFDAPDAQTVKNAVLAALKAHANIRGADLRGANLRGANLRGADLRGARIETGETLDEYVRDVAPALLAAGGKPVPVESWTCHSWRSGMLACPMAAAFAITRASDAPALLRPRVEQFVRLYDAGVIHGPPDEHGHLRLVPAKAKPAEGPTETT